MKKLTKRTTVVVLAALLVVGAAAGYMVWYNSGSQTVSRACQRAAETHGNYRRPAGLDELTGDDAVCMAAQSKKASEYPR